MPTMGQAGNRGRTKQVGGKISQKSFAQLRTRQAIHRLSLPDLLELFALRMTDSEVKDTVARAKDVITAGRNKQVSGKVSEETYDILRRRRKEHDLSTPDVIEMIAWYVSDTDIENLLQRDRKARQEAA